MPSKSAGTDHDALVEGFGVIEGLAVARVSVGETELEGGSDEKTAEVDGVSVTIDVNRIVCVTVTGAAVWVAVTVTS